MFVITATHNASMPIDESTGERPRVELAKFAGRPEAEIHKQFIEKNRLWQKLAIEERPDEEDPVHHV